MRGVTRTILLWAIAVIGACAMPLQVYIAVTRDLDHTLLWRLIDFASYFTNTTGALATVVAILALARPTSRLAQPGAITATAIYLAVTAVTYEWLLRGETHGLKFLTNTALHQVMPALFLLLWLACTPKAGLNWREPLAWIVYPAAYMVWILARGAVLHRYPYFFADVDKLGYPRALLNGAGFLAVFYLLGLGAVAIGRLTETFPFRFRPKNAT